MRDRGIGQRERTAIEMKVLIDSLAFGGCYDQLNLPSLLCVEVLCRRVGQIIEAYDGDPSRPNWSGVRYMLGDANPLNVVPQQAKAYNARRIKDELEIESARVRGQNVGGGAPTGGKAGGGEDKTSDGGADRTPAGGKAGGRTRARKLPAAEAT